MCKHVAAVLYGVGARLDSKPELLFRLRAVNENDLVADIGQALPMSKQGPAVGKVLEADDMAALFGLDMAGADDPAEAGAAALVAKATDKAVAAGKGAKAKGSSRGQVAVAAGKPDLSAARPVAPDVTLPKRQPRADERGTVAAAVGARNGKAAVPSGGKPEPVTRNAGSSRSRPAERKVGSAQPAGQMSRGPKGRGAVRQAASLTSGRPTAALPGKAVGIETLGRSPAQPVPIPVATSRKTRRYAASLTTAPPT